MKKYILPNLNYLSGTIHFGYLAQSLDSFSSEVKFGNIYDSKPSLILELFDVSVKKKIFFGGNLWHSWNLVTNI